MDLLTRVAEYLLAQGRRSTDGRGACQYRGRDGTKCAVGCLIADEHYSPEFENRTIGDSSVRLALRASIGRALSAKEWRLLHKLQCMHDIYPPHDWPECLAELGYKP